MLKKYIERIWEDFISNLNRKQDGLFVSHKRNWRIKNPNENQNEIDQKRSS
jgi:hypothetical protein